jgi:hypothetical protein
MGGIAREWPILLSDELPKRRSDRYGCLDMVTGSRFGKSRVPQNPGPVKTNAPAATS